MGGGLEVGKGEEHEGGEFVALAFAKAENAQDRLGGGLGGGPEMRRARESTTLPVETLGPWAAGAEVIERGGCHLEGDGVKEERAGMRREDSTNKS
jgi:hypothetical protein